jgi:hypothetical protein
VTGFDQVERQRAAHVAESDKTNSHRTRLSGAIMGIADRRALMVRRMQTVSPLLPRLITHERDLGARTLKSIEKGRELTSSRGCISLAISICGLIQSGGGTGPKMPQQPAHWALVLNPAGLPIGSLGR